MQHFGGDDAAYRRAKAFFADDPATDQARTLRSVIDEGLANYAAVFVPGGQAPVVDLMQDADAGEILRHFHAQKKPTALLCHGPIVVAAKDVVWAKLEALRDGAAIASRRLWR